MQSPDFVINHLNDITCNTELDSTQSNYCYFFQRLNTANEEIIEVLLSKQQVSLASFMINFFQIIAFHVFFFLTWPFHFVSFFLFT